jgi:signal peptidase II
MIQKISKNSLHLIYLISFLVILDFFTKWFFTNKEIGNFFISISYTQNIGSSFGLFSNILYYNLIIIILSFGVLGYFIKNFKKIKLEYFKKNTYYFYAFIFFLSGIIGNLIDRIFYGFVKDFIKLENFFTFNLADLYLNITLILIIIYEIKLFIQLRKTKTKK